ncbi:hypothetical protein [Mangrovicoccus algicola]|uniref:Uncharacterized protein n=1 Tax=Mangrovicoccus algicola TaxID=2771008 RepID=A0A8J6Z4C7_9RHOB|nr:hypothetical protein [Mangrovicoccus algicola]MBE3637344.1 hypothetical protein [Mangrovicoccus algicola]
MAYDHINPEDIAHGFTETGGHRDEQDRADRLEEYRQRRAESYDATTRKRSRYMAIAADAYQDAKDRNAGNDEAVQAIAVLAACLYDPNTDYIAPNASEANALAFQQKGALGNIANNAKWMLESAQQRRDELWQKFDQVEATMDGSEIALRNLERVVSQIEQTEQTQIPACEEYLEIAKSAYEGVIGEKWTPYAKNAKDAKDQSREAILARVQALRGKPAA